MKVHLLSVVLIVIIIGCVENTDYKIKEKREVEEAVLQYAIDGDTVVSSLGTIRLVGMDTPEKGECGFASATERMRNLVKDKDAQLTPDSMQELHDKYGRLLRYIEIDGVDIGELMLREGLAHVYLPLPSDRKKHYYRIEKTASEKGIGSWSECGW